MQKRFVQGFVLAIFAAMLVACSGGSIYEADTDTDTGEEPDQVPTGITLVATTTTLPSNVTSASNGVTLTAVLTDANSAAIAGEVVTFDPEPDDSGVRVTTTQGTTDESGQAIAVVTIANTASAQENRSVTIRARSASRPTVLDTITIDVTGTTIDASGATTATFNAIETYTILVKDAAGNALSGKAVEIESAQNNPVTNAAGVALANNTATTDTNGRATVRVAFNSTSDDTLTFSALGLSEAIEVEVTSDTFAFSTPAADDLVPLNTEEDVTVCWQRGPADVNGATIKFSATRGTFPDGNTATTVAGCATVTISATGAGFTTVKATGSDGTTTLTATRRFEFVAVTPATLNLQASPSIVNTLGESTIIAEVRDADANPVKGVSVLFQIDEGPGEASSPEVITDSAGRAETIYQATSLPTGSNGVHLVAGVDMNDDGDLLDAGDITDDVYLTVGGQALRITLGTDELLDGTTNAPFYDKKYAVQVTDSSGKPAPDAELTLSIHALSYRKGCSEKNEEDIWIRTDCNGGAPITCTSEDLITPTDDFDLNGTMDPGENVDGDRFLDPENVAAVIDEDDVVGLTDLDDDGKATFVVRYLQDHALWATVLLKAVARVGGSEGVAETTFLLPILTADAELTFPPGELSPYGIQQDCTRESLIFFNGTSTTRVEPTSGTSVVSVTVNMETGLKQPVTVPLTFSGDAIGGTDYSCTPSQLVFPASELPPSASVSCTINSDNVNKEGRESIILTLGTPDQYAFTDPSRSSHVINITDSDPSVLASESALVATEGTTTSFSVVLTTMPTDTVTIAVTEPGDADDDIDALPTTLTFTTGNWNSAQLVTVTANDDADDDDGESFTVRLTSTSADANYNAQVEDVSVSVIDNDAAVVPTP